MLWSESEYVSGALLLHLFIIIVCSSAHCLSEADLETDWEYEPQVWSFDDSLSNEEESDELEASSSYQQTDVCGSDSGGNCGSIYNVENRHNSDYQEDDPHRRQYFLRSTTRQGGSNQNGTKEECTQLRVDVQEAVVCDSTRCDKFDFEWPRYDNQLTVIETTKHGMRFHRVDYAFAETITKKSTDREFVQDDAGERIKFDLLDLFKPKPSSTTMNPMPNTPTQNPHEASTMTPPTIRPFVSPQTNPPPGPTSTSAPPTTPLSSTTITSTTTTTNPYGTSSTPISPTTQPTAPVTISTTTLSPDQPTGERDAAPQEEKLITTFRLSSRRPKQTMIGFGGALSDSTCYNIKSLSPEMAKSLMEDYYGDRGLRYNIARMSIGSSDFSLSPYTNNDRGDPSNNSQNYPRYQSNEEDDLEMRNFHLVPEDYDYKLPVARQAIATSRQEIKFFSSMWSPPVWMKNNSHIVHGYLKGDVYGPYYRALAEYMVKWMDAYRRNGLNLWGMTVMNEPVTGVKPFIFHNSLGITQDDYVTFIKLYLGPILKQYGFENVKLMALDDNKGYIPFWAKAVLEDQEASKYISGIGVHWYMNDEYENMNLLSKYFPDKFILATEACNGYLPFQVHALPGDWDRGVAYMFDIIKTIQKNSAGWVDWNMVLDLYGGPSWVGNYLDAPVIVNPSRDEYYKSPMFYAMGHFSKFVERNSTRLDHRIANARYDYPLEAVGFKTPKDYIVIVALNANKHKVPFKIIVDRKHVRTVTLRADSFNTLIFKWNNST